MESFNKDKNSSEDKNGRPGINLSWNKLLLRELREEREEDEESWCLCK